MSEPLSELEQKRLKLIKIVENSGIYKKYEDALYTYSGVHVDDGARVTLTLSGRKLRVWLVNYKVKTEAILAIDPELFRTYIYNIVGLKCPG